jgi:hypothetical protein
VHACAQLLQFCESVCLLVHVMPQRSGVEPAQFEVQDEPAHAGVGAAQVVPHTPQLPFCDRSSTQPFPLWAQSANPGAQE